MSQNNDLLLEALAEKQANMEKEIKQLKEKSNQPAKSYNPDQLIKSFDNVLKGYNSRIKKLELETVLEQKVEVVESTDNRHWKLPPWRHTILVLAGAVALSLLIDLAYTGYTYRQYFYKYKAVKLLGISVKEADAYYSEIPSTLKKAVNDSLEVIKARQKVIEYQSKINQIEGE